MPLPRALRHLFALALVFVSLHAGCAQEPRNSSADLALQVHELREQVALLAAQVAELRGQRPASGLPALAPAASDPNVITSTPTASTPTDLPARKAPAPQPAAAPSSSAGSAMEAAAAAPTATPEAGSFHGTTFSTTFDGYYEYNFNSPYDQTTQLRINDPAANSFSISQATIVLEHAPDPASGSHFGGRVDLQFGQAASQLQGSATYELHPEIWRNVFQAYGTFVAPIGHGLHMDFGKFASSLGVEGNYNKDQITYSRALLFNALPFYHMGLRATYDVSPRVDVAYWLVNGDQQTDDFNGFKSQAFLFTLKPAKTVTWNVNYYFGQESRNTTAAGLPVLPTPNGRQHIFDTYATWTPTANLTLIGEADLVVNRTYGRSEPQQFAGGEALARYQLPRGYALAARAEYIADPEGLFTGFGQAVKEVTAILEHKFAEGFVLRTEYRHGFSNKPFFHTSTPGILNHSLPTAGLGLIWWWGGKQGAW